MNLLGSLTAVPVWERVWIGDLGILETDGSLTESSVDNVEVFRSRSISESEFVLLLHGCQMVAIPANLACRS